MVRLFTAAALLAAGVLLTACASDSAYVTTTSVAAAPAPAPMPSPARAAPRELTMDVMRKVPAPSPMMPAPADTSKFPEASANPVKVTAEDPVSTFSIDVDTASYAVVRRFLRDGRVPPDAAVRVEEMVNYFPYDYPAPQNANRPLSPRVTILPNPWNPETRLMHVSVKARDLDAGTRPRMNLVLLVDVSGSMSPPDRLPLLRQVFSSFVQDLREDDTVSIVSYANGVAERLTPTAARDKDRIQAAIAGLVPGGGTAGSDGIQRAYALARSTFDPKAVNRIVLATDGDFNVGITDPKQLERYVADQRKTGIYLSILGVGLDNLNDRLMQRLSQAGNGNAAYIDSANEGRKVLGEEMASTLLPVADDVKIQVEFNPARVAEYRLIGYETRLLRRQDFADDAIDAGEVGSGHKVTALYEITPVDAKPYVAPLRYGNDAAKPAGKPATSSEYAHVRLRYKQPGQSESRLMERPVTEDDVFRSWDAVPVDIRFATAVAAFGQKLQGSSFVAKLGWDRIAELAQAARGEDANGYRAEFVQLVKTAGTLPR